MVNNLGQNKTLLIKYYRCMNIFEIFYLPLFFIQINLKKSMNIITYKLEILLACKNIYNNILHAIEKFVIKSKIEFSDANFYF